MSAELLAAAPRLRWIQLPVAGVERMVTPAMLAHGMAITTFSGVTAPNIAEHILAMMFAFARNLPALLQQQQGR